MPQGSTSKDVYRYSPDELLTLGRLANEKGDNAAALRYYTELIDQWHGKPYFGLNDTAYKKAVMALFDIYLQVGPAAKVVQYCEIMKERWPEEPVTLKQLLAAAVAYRDIGEFERSYGVCRAVIESQFIGDSGIAGFLDEQGQYLRSVQHMSRILQEYPPESYVAEAELELAQQVYAKASEPVAGPHLPSRAIAQSAKNRTTGT